MSKQLSSEAPRADSNPTNLDSEDLVRLGRRRLLLTTLAAVPTVLTLTARSASAASPSNAPSRDCESLPPDTPGCEPA